MCLSVLVTSSQFSETFEKRFILFGAGFLGSRMGSSEGIRNSGDLPHRRLRRRGGELIDGRSKYIEELLHRGMIWR